MNEFNPNCGKCGMLNSRGFCSLTACRYPSNVIVVDTKVIRGMMVNPQIEKPVSNGDKIRSMTDEELAELIAKWAFCDECVNLFGFKVCETKCCSDHWLDWLKSPVEVDNG